MSQVPLTAPVHRMVSTAVTLRSTVLFAALFTRVPETRGGRVPRVSPANPDPAIVPVYCTSGNWPTDSNPPTLTGLAPPVVNVPVRLSGARVGFPDTTTASPPPFARVRLAMVTFAVPVVPNAPNVPPADTVADPVVLIAVGTTM